MTDEHGTVAAPVERPVRPVMRLNRVDYVEKPAPNADNHPMGVCRFCALFETLECNDAIDDAAQTAFGGDCETRDVVYARA